MNHQQSILRVLGTPQAQARVGPAMDLLLILIGHANKKGEVCMSATSLAKCAGMSDRTCLRRRQALVKDGTSNELPWHHDNRRVVIRLSPSRISAIMGRPFSFGDARRSASPPDRGAISAKNAGKPRRGYRRRPAYHADVESMSAKLAASVPPPYSLYPPSSLQSPDPDLLKNGSTESQNATADSVPTVPDEPNPPAAPVEKCGEPVEEDAELEHILTDLDDTPFPLPRKPRVEDDEEWLNAGIRAMKAGVGLNPKEPKRAWVPPASSDLDDLERFARGDDDGPVEATPAADTGGDDPTDDDEDPPPPRPSVAPSSRPSPPSGRQALPKPTLERKARRGDGKSSSRNGAPGGPMGQVVAHQSEINPEFRYNPDYCARFRKLLREWQSLDGTVEDVLAMMTELADRRWHGGLEPPKWLSFYEDALAEMVKDRHGGVKRQAKRRMGDWQNFDETKWPMGNDGARSLRHGK